MKSIFVSNLLKDSDNSDVSLSAWLSNRRNSGSVVFLDLVDSTGLIQAVCDRSLLDQNIFSLAQSISLESAVQVKGKLVARQNRLNEILINEIVVLSSDELHLSPQPRSTFDVFDERLADQLLRNRHLYIRNPKLMAILRFRSVVMGYVRHWFEENQFLEIDAPILTAVPLYEDASAISLEIDDEKVFLTQCVGYYLEAAVHAFERVYNMGPSFRGEESRSKRHLMEYWHIKAEIAFADLEDIISIVESIISMVSRQCLEHQGHVSEILGSKMCLDGIEIPFPRISYEEAIQQLQKMGMDIQYGKSLGSPEESELSKLFNKPFWITGIPRIVEPFPYVVDSHDPRVTRVADLIATNGYGELLGVAEKISDLGMLDERMREKGKFGDERYKWVRDVHRSGCVPHAAFGMGLERLVRWILNVPHVRDAIPFPRIFRRHVYP